MTKQDIIELVQNCRTLEELSFYNVAELTPDLCDLIKNNLLNLRVLNIYGCKNSGTMYNNQVFCPKH